MAKAKSAPKKSAPKKKTAAKKTAPKKSASKAEAASKAKSAKKTTKAKPTKKAAPKKSASKTAKKATPKKAAPAKSTSAANSKSKIKVGNKAPAFSLPTYGGEKVRLADYAGKYLIVYFYPKDMTPGCTIEAQAFRDSAARLTSLNAEVVGVSKDSVQRHEKFRDKHELNFPLLSDEGGAMLEKYGAWGEKKLYGRVFDGIIRSTVLVGPDGRVIQHFPKVRVKGHVDAVLDAIEAHQAGQ